MKKLLAAVIALGLGCGVAQAADMPMAPPMQMVAWTWTGLYLGGQFGPAFGNSKITDPAGPAIFGNNVRTTGALGGVQIGYNWQIPNTAFVLGAEADASVIGSAGSATCLASSPYFIPANCRVMPDAMGSMTARLGYATGPHGRNLFYVKGGLAWVDDRIDITTGGVLPLAMTTFDGLRWGWTVGAGIERSLTPAWSLRLEYDYAKFGDLSINTPASSFQPSPFLDGTATAGGRASMSQNLQTIKVGLNYKVGEDMFAQWEPNMSLRGAYVPDAEIEVGGRVWYSSGSFQKDLGGTAPLPPNLLVSRLTYNSTAATGEVFGRIDTASNVFIKGFGGGGTILSGNQNDEDFNIDGVIPYSNSQATTKGDLAYGTFDVGYSVFRGPSANVGGFVGLNYYRENKQAYGCVQISHPFSDCVAGSPFSPASPASVLGISEDDNWYSMRVGVNGVVSIWNGLKLTADAAWLPFVAFRGTDIHWQRTDVSNQTSPESGNGQGMQLEAILSYAFVNGFSVGAGGRYWAMWANNAQTNAFSEGFSQAQPVRTERYGAFVQAAYKFNGLNF